VWETVGRFILIMAAEALMVLIGAALFMIMLVPIEVTECWIFGTNPLC
jgi:hypothetical protein